jgi:hypothetical protein
MVVPMDARKFPVQCDDIPALCPAMYPYLDRMTFKTVVPNDEMIAAFLMEDFQDMLMLTRGEACGLLKRLPPEMVRVRVRQSKLHRF